MAQINWTDGTGAASLVSSYPAPGNRFNNWRPSARAFGEGAHGLGDGTYYKFAFRTDYEVSFDFSGLPEDATTLTLLARLEAHLTAGGICELETEDTNSNIYAACCLISDDDFVLEMTDKQNKEYTLSLRVRSIAVTPVPFVVAYP